MLYIFIGNHIKMLMLYVINLVPTSAICNWFLGANLYSGLYINISILRYPNSSTMCLIVHGKNNGRIGSKGYHDVHTVSTYQYSRNDPFANYHRYLPNLLHGF